MIGALGLLDFGGEIGLHLGELLFVIYGLVSPRGGTPPDLPTPEKILNSLKHFVSYGERIEVPLRHSRELIEMGLHGLLCLGQRNEVGVPPLSRSLEKKFQCSPQWIETEETILEFETPRMRAFTA